MSKLLQSQAVFTNYTPQFKLRKNLSIETSVSTKRGLSLVSEKGESTRNSSKKNSREGSQIKQISSKIKQNLFDCSIKTCVIDKMAQQQYLIQLKPKKVVSVNLRQRNTNLLSKDIMQSFLSTSQSFESSKVGTLWNINSPINKLL